VTIHVESCARRVLIANCEMVKVSLNPKPKTLNPKTLNPKTLNPKTLNPKTLNPKP
jgi:hypothetical protein